MFIFLIFWVLAWELSESLRWSRTMGSGLQDTLGNVFSCGKHTVKRVFMFYPEDQYSFDSEQKGEPERHSQCSLCICHVVELVLCHCAWVQKSELTPFPSFCLLILLSLSSSCKPIHFSSNKNICKVKEASWMSICCFNFHHIILILWRLLVSVRWYVGLWGFVPVGTGNQEHAAVCALVPLSTWSRKVGILCILFPYRGRKFISWAGRCIGWTELCLDWGFQAFLFEFWGFCIVWFCFLFYFNFFSSPLKKPTPNRSWKKTCWFQMKMDAQLGFIWKSFQ